jgi:phosphate starvation-inducible PhoH-like protein
MSKNKRLKNKKTKFQENLIDTALILSQPPRKDKSPVVHQRNKIDRQLQILKRSDLTEKQNAFISLALDTSTKIIFVSGPAGVSKTYLSVLASLLLLNNKKVSDLIYLRSVVESSSRSMGFLPGDLDLKMGVYLRPLTDKLSELLPSPDIKYLKDDHRISGEPINFLRGQSWNAMSVIVDESQNLTYKELLTVITRIGPFSKIMLLGDPEQSDIKDSGFVKMMSCFDDNESASNGIHCVKFDESDCLRSGICKFILEKLKNIK